MRPTVEELLERLESTFNDVILGELQSDYAKTRGTVLSGIINHLRTRYDREQVLLEEACDDLTRTLRDISSKLGYVQGASMSTLRQDIEKAPLPQSNTGDDPIGELRARYVESLELAERMVDELAGLEAGGDARVREPRRELLRLLRRNIDRDLQLVAPPVHGARTAPAE
jgi:hypothetical protein